MPYTTVDIFREKGDKSLSKKVWEPLNFMKKYVKKITVEFFVVFNSNLVTLTRISILTSI
jgi:hypothetical protein